MNYRTQDDGITHLNIGSLAKTPIGRCLSYYDDTPKRLPDGRPFFLYAGYYYFLIVKGHHPRFLRAKTLKDLEAKKRFDFTNVPGLPEDLAHALTHNLRRSSITLAFLRENDLPIVWYEPDRELRAAEKRWLNVVQMVVRRLRRTHHPA